MTGIQAARVAASLKRELHLEVETVEGRYGEFAVFADGEEIIRGGSLGFVGVLPSVRTVRDVVERKLRATPGTPPPRTRGGL